MNAVTIKLTVHAALELLTSAAVSPTTRDEIKQSIIQSWSSANPALSRTTKYLNLTLKTVSPMHKIRCIAAVRNNLGWGLKESKDFVESVLGKQEMYGVGPYLGGAAASLTGLTDDINSLANELMQLGCEVVTDTWGCENPD